MLNILITGFRGRMGQSVAISVSEEADARVSAGIDLGDSLEEALSKSDIVIDFTLPSFTNELIEGCVDAGKPLVMGTTGHDASQL
ncbi:MAG TPA: 4-hydroxy-tetrahydrodipicolinate reductase, partial [Verrucomicrobiales bacterium]|nr:4-hydroxy-tetrahydrodipicolinate reductase [Verrucomicrobiales bacterium]